MIAVRLVLMVLAIVAFLLRAIGVQTRVDLIALGLFCWALTLVVV